MPEPVKRANAYPHELSGGMRQRVMIAMALLCQPKILIADEPTTALDVTVQAQMLDLFKTLTDDFGTSLVLITHDLGVVAGVADRMMVMYGGRAVEKGSVDDLFYDPRHPYTLRVCCIRRRISPSVQRGSTRSRGCRRALNTCPSGCAFNPRCAFAFDRCLAERPPLTETGNGTGESLLLRRPDGGYGKVA